MNFVLAQGTLQATKVNFVLLAQKKFHLESAPLPFLGYIYLPVEYGYTKIFRLQLTDLHYPVGN